MKRSLLALVLASAATTSAMAQQAPYATIKSLEGLVTVTTNNQLTNATPNMALPQGAQVLTTSAGKATVQFASGCTATIQGGQALAIQESACTSFLAANPGAGAGGGAAGGGLFTPGRLLLGAAGLGLLYDQTRGGGSTPTTVAPVTPPAPAAPAPVVPAPVVVAPVPISGS